MNTSLQIKISYTWSWCSISQPISCKAVVFVWIVREFMSIRQFIFPHDTKVNAFVFNKLPVTVTCTYLYMSPYTFGSVSVQGEKWIHFWSGMRNHFGSDANSSLRCAKELIRKGHVIPSLMTMNGKGETCHGYTIADGRNSEWIRRYASLHR